MHRPRSDRSIIIRSSAVAHTGNYGDSLLNPQIAVRIWSKIFYMTQDAEKNETSKSAKVDGDTGLGVK
jgi:hypothetical protein